MVPGSHGATQFQTMGQMPSQTTPQKVGNNNFMQTINTNNAMTQQLTNFSTDLSSPNLLQQQQQVTQSNLSNSGPNTPNSQVEEEPLYVNAKQYNRILKRRQARNKLENEGRIPKVRMVRNYLVVAKLLDLTFK